VGVAAELVRLAVCALAIAVERIRGLVPAQLTIQEFDGVSWIGVIPFRMTGVMRRPLPDVPWMSAFPELNVRLYVEHAGKPGVFFLSLDAANPLAVWAARRWFRLPYWFARMRHRREGDGFSFSSVRRPVKAGIDFHAHYRAVGEVYHATPGTLAHFLTERYCLYTTARDGRLLRSDIHHAPWPLQSAEAEVDPAAMLRPVGLKVEGSPVLHFSTGVEAIVWGLVEA
jgi:uncharacterized protein YqjF (DUF2071 family)